MFLLWQLDLLHACTRANLGTSRTARHATWYVHVPHRRAKRLCACHACQSAPAPSLPSQVTHNGLDTMVRRMVAEMELLLQDDDADVRYNASRCAPAGVRVTARNRVRRQGFTGALVPARTSRGQGQGRRPPAEWYSRRRGKAAHATS